MDCGFATWESADYFKKWQQNLVTKLQLLNTKVKETLKELKEEDHEGTDSDILQCSQEIDENKDVPVQIRIKRENKNNTNPELPLAKGRTNGSVVWNHFSKDKETGICTCHHCGTTLVSLQGSTTSMRNHIALKHPDQINTSAMSPVEPIMNPETGEMEMESRSKPGRARGLIKDPDSGELVGVKEFKRRCKKRLKVEKMKKKLEKFERMKMYEVCPHCGKSIQSQNLSNHIKYVHDRDFKWVQCPNCEHMAKTQCDLKRHISAKHTESNPVNCPWCGGYTKHLERHLKMHQCNVPESERVIKERSKCPLCEKTFHKVEAMKSHIQSIHEKIKNFQCDQCDFKTYNKSNLYGHVKRVHEGRSYKEQCPHCPKIVVNLEYHIETYHQGHIGHKGKAGTF